jgi:L-seryl-tRNA(Ser) seleniumtransferase
MWSRRRFLETFSALPLVGGFAGAGAAPAAAATSAAAQKGRDYFAELGVRPFINAAGTYTAMSASLMPPEVIAAYEFASKRFVMLDELHDKVGQRIATLLRAEGAMVTSGAASALTLGTAGVLTGKDPQKAIALPDLAGMKSEVLIQKAHRFGYEHAVRNCGVRLVEVETPDDVDHAVSDKTAMMLFYNAAAPPGSISDQEWVRLGKKHGIPTLNDAAADVPPVENLWKYTAMGFDLVAFSGGKGIRGPQSAGLLLGRKDLIEAARLSAPPNGNTVGRGMKVNKEEMISMLAALERFVKMDHALENKEFERRAELIRASATAVKGVKAEVFVPPVSNHVPHIRISWDGGDEPAAAAVVKAMKDGEPSIVIRNEKEALVVGVWMMQPGEDKIVARRLRQVLEKKA